MSSATVEKSAEAILEPVRRRLGFVPNLFKEMSVSPAALKVYLGGQEALGHGSLTMQEQQAVQLTISAFNACHYCQAAHQWLGRQTGIAPEDLWAIRAGASPTDKSLAVIVRATRLIFEKKGWLMAGELRMLEQQGITKAKLYEIVAFIGLKTISNYVNHIAHTPIDQEFAG